MIKPRELRAEVRRVYEKADDDLSLALREREGPPVQCARGCAGCCHSLVKVTAPEALVIAAEARLTGDSSDLKQAVHLAVAELEDCLIKEPGDPNREWFRRRNPCPLLRGAECSRYALRPAACRLWLVTSPPQLCSPEAGTQRITYLNVAPQAQRLGFYLDEVSRRRKWPTGLDYLPRQLAWALTWWER